VKSSGTARDATAPSNHRACGADRRHHPDHGRERHRQEMVARELYRHSPRRNEPYIKVSCAAVSENLIESEFLTRERVLHGASDRREGRFELANRGTLLLDEVSEIP